jgi:hypothetical protein
MGIRYVGAREDRSGQIGALQNGVEQLRSCCDGWQLRGNTEERETIVVEEKRKEKKRERERWNVGLHTRLAARQRRGVVARVSWCHEVQF